MPRLKFKATHLTYYHDKPQDWHDGDEQDVSDRRAKHLLTDFPDDFSVVGSTKAEPAPENKMDSPTDDKGVFRRRGRPPKSGK